MSRTRRLSIASALLVGAVACGTGDGPPAPVTGVPDDAAWVPAADRGVWISCEPKDEGAGRYVCTVYDGATGEARVSSGFLLRRAVGVAGERTYEAVPEPPALRYEFWNGDRILLRDSLVLLPEHRFHDTF